MYSSRQSRYQQQIYRGINLGQQSSDAASIVPLQSTNQNPPTAAHQERNNKRSFEQVSEEAANTPQYKRIVFADRKGLAFVKRLQWKRFPEPVRKQMRRIMNTNFSLTLGHIAGATENSVYYEINTALTDVAKKIDQSLKTHLIPGNFDTNILNSVLPEAIAKEKKDFSERSKEVAKEMIIMERKKELLEQEKAETDRSREIAERKSILENCAIKDNAGPRTMDYTQSLMRFPSSSIFDPPN